MLAFLSFFIIIVALVVGGVFVNVYFYSREAGTPSDQQSYTLKAVTMRQEAVIERKYQEKFAAKDNGFRECVRRFIYACLLAIAAGIGLIAMFMSFAH